MPTILNGGGCSQIYTHLYVQLTMAGLSDSKAVAYTYKISCDETEAGYLLA